MYNSNSLYLDKDRCAVFLCEMSDTEELVVPSKRPKKLKKEDVIKNKKVRGEAHINHKGKGVETKKVGPDCR